jgi:hypothetical protein
MIVMAGLVPAIYLHDVDARNKSGHDSLRKEWADS